MHQFRWFSVILFYHSDSIDKVASANLEKKAEYIIAETKIVPPLKLYFTFYPQYAQVILILCSEIAALTRHCPSKNEHLQEPFRVRLCPLLDCQAPLQVDLLDFQEPFSRLLWLQRCSDSLPSQYLGSISLV